MKNIFKLLICIILLVTSSHAQAPSPVIFNGSFAKLIPQTGLRLFDLKELRTLSVDPTAGAGVAAAIGSIGLRDNGGAGEGWFKVGAADTAWTNFLTASSGWSLLGNSGTNATTNFLGTTDAVDLVLRANNTERFRITSAGDLDTTLATGAAYLDATGVLLSEPQLALSRGGTNANNTAAAGAVAYSNASGIVLNTPGTTGQVLFSNGTSAPSWADIPTADTVWVDKSGNDTTCALGAINRPCLTVVQAVSLIGTPTSGTRKRIQVGTGTFTETGLTLKPWTYIVGASGALMGGNSRISTTNVTLDPAWSAGSQRGGFFNIYFTGSTNLVFDLQAIAATSSHVFELFNVGVNGSITMLANSGTLDFLDVYALRVFGGINLSGGSISLVNSQVYGPSVFDNAGTQDTEFTYYNSDIEASVSITQSGGNTMTGSLTGNYLASTLTTIGTVTLNSDAISLPADSTDLILSGGTTLTRYTDAYAVAYTPTTPADWTVVPTTVEQGLDYLAGGGFAGLANYLYLPGRPGGQIAAGGTDAGDDLVLRSTTDATKGQIILDETTASTSPTTGALRVDGGAGIGGALNVAGAIRSNTSLVLEDPGAGTNTTTIQAGTVSSNYTVTLPTAQGAANTTLLNDGAGALSWASLLPTVFGSRQTPVTIVAGTGITSGASAMSTTAIRQQVFVDGTGGVDITANPQIEAGTLVGQEMVLCGTDNADYVYIENGNGLSLNGPAELGKDDCITLRWLGTDGSTSDWVEISRNL